MAKAGDADAPSRVGYGNPPKRTQFTAGKSGNPSGRPKGSKNFATVIQSELNRRVVVNEGGRRKTITKRDAIAKQLVNKSTAGDLKAIPVVLNETRSHEIEAGAAAPQSVIMTEEQLVMKNIVQRIREATATPASSGASAAGGPPSPCDSEVPADNEQEGKS
jgi:hypothetical protein